MNSMMSSNVLLIVILIGLINAGCFYSEPTRPTFPDVFSVNVEATFVNEPAEADATVYYDGPKNMAILDMFYQNEDTKQIFLFNDNEILTITGSECTVESIPDNPAESFFPFNNVQGRKVIAPPENILFFHNSGYDNDDLDNFQPLLVYSGKVDIYGQKDCDITHYFTKPEFTMPQCDLRTCVSTLVKIVLRCHNAEDETDVLFHRYEFFRFKDFITDYTEFQPPQGVYCKRKSTTKPPTLPKYFSFSYDIFKRQRDVPTIAKGQSVEHYTLWYDDDIKTIRIDKYKENGQMYSKKIYDLKSGTLYETLNGLIECTSQSLPGALNLEEASNLPDFIFPWLNESKYEKPIYVGQRMVQDIEYEVWSSQAKIMDSEVKIIKDVYFMKMYGESTNSDEFSLQLTSIQEYEYQAESVTKVFKVQETKDLILNHFLTSPRDWTVFDISNCFDDGKKSLFEIEITGSAVENLDYNQFTAILFLRLLVIGKVPVTQLGKLTLVHKTGNNVSFTGNIIKNEVKDSDTNTQIVYDRLKKNVEEGLFTFSFTNDGKKLTFQATYFGEPRTYSFLDSNSDPKYTGGAMAALGIVMTGVGGILGGIGIYLYLSIKKRQQLS